MFKKLASAILVAAITCTIGGTSAFAANASDPSVKDDPAARVPAEAPEKEAAKPNEQLKTNLLKLVADAKAGKVRLPAKSQMQPVTGNNLSKGKKIAIGVGIAVIVIAVIVVIHEKNHFFDDFRLGN